MSKTKTISKRKILRVDDLLNNNVWDVDYEPHIKIDPSKCIKCEWKPCIRLCPAECYTMVGEEVLFSYEGCVECGTCRIVCPEEAITWEYPVSGRGIHYRFS
jgi:ferredoxin like protein